MIRIEHLAKLRFLLRRTGFGAPPAAAAQLAGQSLEAVVEGLLQGEGDPEPIAPPLLGKEPFDGERLVDLQAYWLHRMVVTGRPLVEKMTLFWHGHFATGIAKAKAVPMQQQNERFRRHALGNFPVLLKEMGTDAAMLLWLDGHGSTRRAPNENYAREVMELFTTGPGPYTETDIREAARAFTGWRAEKETGRVHFRQTDWDPGEKTFLGQRGRFAADEIARILAVRPETPRMLAQKLWRFFASPTPDAATVDAMVKAYTESGGELRPMLRTLFLAPAFYGAGPLVKSPAELVAGTYRLLGLPVTREAAAICTRMGQALFEPPNVAGWPGGATWLGASALLTRWNFGEGVRQLLGQKSRPALLGTAKTAPELVQAALDLFDLTGAGDATRQALLGLVGRELPADPRRRWELTRDLIRTLVAAPEYQLA